MNEVCKYCNPLAILPTHAWHQAGTAQMVLANCLRTNHPLEKGKEPDAGELADWVMGNQPQLWDRCGTLQEIRTLIGHWGLSMSTIEMPSDPLGVYHWLAKVRR